MRSAQGGGLTAERREFRERIRYQAGERFPRGEKTEVIAKDLRVSEPKPRLHARVDSGRTRNCRVIRRALVGSDGAGSFPDLSEG